MPHDGIREIMGEIGRWLIGLGLLLVIVGAVFLLAGRIPWLGQLPGDIRIEREHVGGLSRWEQCWLSAWC